MLRYAFVLVLLSTITVSSQISAKPKYSTKIIYYPVTGSSIAQIQQRMSSPNHAGAYATITYKPNLKGKLIQGKSACKLKGFSVPSRFIVHLPKLAGGTRLNKKSRARFASFQKYLRWHEFQHRSITIGCYRRMEKQARRARAKSCRVLDSKVAKIVRAEVARCQRLNARFDKGQRKRVSSHIFVKTAARQRARPAVARTQRAAPRRRNNLGASNR